MVNKSGLTFVAIFAVMLLSLGFASATNCLNLTQVSVPSSVADGDTAAVQFELSNTKSGCSTAKTDLNWTLTSNKAGSFTTVPTLSSIAYGSTQTLSAIFDLNSGQTGNLEITVSVLAEDGSEDNETITLSPISIIEGFCSAGTKGILKLSDITIDNFGVGDDEEWNPLDKIVIEVEVENTHNTESVRDVLVEIKILDDEGNDVTSDFDLDDEEIDLGRIRDDDQEIATFEIPEIPADLDEGTYRVYIKAYSEDDGESVTCVDTSNDLNKDNYQEIELVRDEDFAVVAKDYDKETILASCGDQNIPVSFSVYNIGIDKEESVLVTLFNRELGIDEKIVVNNLREGKRSGVDMFIDVPEKLSKTSYNLDIINYFEYDEDARDKTLISNYDSNSYDDLDERYAVRLDILDCGTTTSEAPTVSAVLDSGAKLGEELVIRATVRNNGADGNFVFSVSGIDDWAEFISITPATLNLGEGSSGEVIIKLSPTKEGPHTFTIDSIVGGEKYSQAISVSIEGKSGVLDGVTNQTLYYALAVLVLLILIFIIVIIRVARRPAAQF